MTAELRFKRLTPTAKVPVYSTEHAACFDIHMDPGFEPQPHKTDSSALILGTGLAFEIEHGKALLLFSRSGHGFNKAIRLSNACAVIDSDYREEVMIALRYDGDHSEGNSRPTVAPGERVVQGLIVSAEQVKFIEVTGELSKTARKGGFGSTGS